MRWLLILPALLLMACPGPEQARQQRDAPGAGPGPGGAGPGGDPAPLVNVEIKLSVKPSVGEGVISFLGAQPANVDGRWIKSGVPPEFWWTSPVTAYGETIKLTAPLPLGLTYMAVLNVTDEPIPDPQDYVTWPALLPAEAEPGGVLEMVAEADFKTFVMGGGGGPGFPEGGGAAGGPPNGAAGGPPGDPYEGPPPTGGPGQGGPGQGGPRQGGPGDGYGGPKVGAEGEIPPGPDQTISLVVGAGAKAPRNKGQIIFVGRNPEKQEFPEPGKAPKDDKPHFLWRSEPQEPAFPLELTVPLPANLTIFAVYDTDGDGAPTDGDLMSKLIEDWKPRSDGVRTIELSDTFSIARLTMRGGPGEDDPDGEGDGPTTDGGETRRLVVTTEVRLPFIRTGKIMVVGLPPSDPEEFGYPPEAKPSFLWKSDSVKLNWPVTLEALVPDGLDVLVALDLDGSGYPDVGDLTTAPLFKYARPAEGQEVRVRLEEVIPVPELDDGGDGKEDEGDGKDDEGDGEEDGNEAGAP